MEFYRYIIESIYQNVQFKFISSHGYGGIMDCMEENDFDIVIMDLKSNSIDVMNIIDELRIRSLHDGLHYYTPVCVEEVILSNRNLQIYKESKIKSLIEDYAYTGKAYYKDTDDNYIILGKQVRNLEKALSAELSRISSIRYTKSKLSGCIMMKCCNTYEINTGKVKCSQFSNLNKIDSFKNSSILGGILNIIDKILGNRAIYLSNWSTESKSKLYN